MQGKGENDKDTFYSIVAGHSIMTVHHSADARTALLATYIARRANPQAGMRITSRGSYPPKSRGNETRGAPAHQNIGCFGARGRTIYNADWYPIKERAEENAVLRELARIDAEEATRLEEEEDTRSTGTGSDISLASEEEMFALYTHIY